ncbi:MAG TPA: hypothetical protein VMI54_14120 [Polyangiaceae bacterium]|nr:hypothetical protein [Polyangiaceae bacterium]
MSGRSGLVLVCCLLGTWVGCAGKSESELEPSPILIPSAGGAAGSAHGGTGGKGGTGTGGSSGKGGSSTGATGGVSSGGGVAVGGGPAGGKGGTGGDVAVGGDGQGTVGGASGKGGTGGGGTGGRGRGGAGAGGTIGNGGVAGSVFGMGGIGAQAGRGGSAGAGGSTVVPATWVCVSWAYGDGVCDCGCGATDSDCPTDAVEACVRCNAIGSCDGGACPGSIDKTDVTKCVPLPAGWTCTAQAYADGKSCDCGCGAPDPDCTDSAIGHCNTCNSVGSCAQSSCPSSIDPNDTTQCAVPALWTCDDAYYGDGICECGCGVPDVDCTTSNSSSCVYCPGDSCSPYSCATVDATDNAHCDQAPTTWTCPTRLYDDGSHCDCGCGAFDPDCSALGAGACDKCNDSGSCSKDACPGTITTDKNWVCTRPTPPANWSCWTYSYADGYTCDCGCGAPDPDCATSDVSACMSCGNCNGSCPASIDPTDTTRCAPPPSNWICDPAEWGDYTCDCGCGAVDPDCYDSTSSSCARWPTAGCSAGISSHISATNNATCSIVAPPTWKCSVGYYADGVCDCGCGALDPDCASANSSECVYCNSAGSCSTAKCPGTISPTDNTSCSQ